MRNVASSPPRPTTGATAHPRYRAAYDPKNRALLSLLAADVATYVEGFTNTFYSHLSDKDTASGILQDLTDDEYQRLKQAQQHHLTRLISPDLTIDAHLADIRAMAHAHEMVGVDLPTLLDAYHLYQAGIDEVLSQLSVNSHQRAHIRKVIELRLKLDLETQIECHYRVERQAAQFIDQFDKALINADNLADLLTGVMDLIMRIDGLVGALFLRPDSSGQLQIEAVGGERGAHYARFMADRSLPLMSIEADKPGGLGPAGQAWRSGQIQTLSNFRITPDSAPWMEIGNQLHFRSCAALPVSDDSNRPFALITLYSDWPRFFNTPNRQILLSHIQRSASHSVAHFERCAVMPVNRRSHYCELLDNSRVRFVYQPIIDLASGKPVHVEILARLEDTDGTLIAPGDFLPAFGKRDLLTLFKLGIDQLSRDMKVWKQAKLSVPVSINLPAEGLVDDAYRDILMAALAAGAIRASDLRLEILETQDPADVGKRDRKLEEFRRLGVTIAQDDLGAGHSSLLRMESIRFDSIKIDQSLVRSAAHNPQKALDFILHLTKLAHAFGIPVTVEGLENQGLIEAAAILGANTGQGYGIARPMFADELLRWAKDRRPLPASRHPRTALGALAGYMLWDQQLKALTPRPELTEEFARAPCLVSKYLETSPDLPPELQRRITSALASNHACALGGAESVMYQRTRQYLMETLSQHWTRSLESIDV